MHVEAEEAINGGTGRARSWSTLVNHKLVSYDLSASTVLKSKLLFLTAGMPRRPLWMRRHYAA